MLDTLPASANFTRTRVEARILEIPLAEDDLDLQVLPRQTRAVPLGLMVVERLSEVGSTVEPGVARHRTDAGGHRPFVRLMVERRTKLNQKTYTGDVSFDISLIQPWLNLSEEGRRFRLNHPRAISVFTPDTVADLVRLSDRALELYAAVDWAALEMTSERQR